MRRLASLLVLGLLLISMLSFVFAVDPPLPPDASGESSGTDSASTLPGQNTAADAEELQKQIEGIQENIPFDPETGKFDVSKIEGIKLKAQERIDKINLWLENNTPWLRFVFRMVPEISWLFAANLYVFLFFFTVLVLNGDEFFFFISKESLSYFSGLAVFVILLVTHVYLNLAKLLVNVVDFVLNTILPWGTVVFIVAVVILLILFFTIPSFATLVLKSIASVAKWMGYRDTAAGALKEIRKRSQEELAVMKAQNEGAGI